MEQADARGSSLSPDELENTALKYMRALRRTSFPAVMVYFIYPFLTVFLTTLLAGSIPGLIAIPLVYYALVFLMMRQRYSIDSRVRGVECGFGYYARNSPIAFTSLKFALLETAIFLSLVAAVYLRPDALMAIILLVAFLSAIFAIMHFGSWIRKAMRQPGTLNDGPVTRELERICSEAGIALPAVYIIDGSSFRIANAYVTGYFKPRVCITDYALENLDTDETVSVLAHEISHYRRRDPLRNMLPSLITLVVVGGSIVAVGIMSIMYGSTFEKSVITPGLVEVLALAVFAGFLFPGSILYQRGEKAADRFAVKYGGSGSLISGLKKIYPMNGTSLHTYSKATSRILFRMRDIEKYGNENR